VLSVDPLPIRNGDFNIMLKLISFIGTRDLDAVSDEVLALYQQAVESAVHAGYTIVTGAAQGADQLAADTALMAGGHVMLKLPWATYERAWVTQIVTRYPDKVWIEVYYPFHHDSWTQSVYQYHPKPDSLRQGPFALHARNFGIMENATTVVAISNPNKIGGGGTGQGLRIAEALRIRRFDLTDPMHFEDLETRLACRTRKDLPCPI
jgi:hypothetical protein